MRAVEAVDRCTREDAGGTDGDAGVESKAGGEGRGQRERGTGRYVTVIAEDTTSRERTGYYEQ